jgi:hypothetical protein
VTATRRAGSPAPHAANAALAHAVQVALAEHGVPSLELRDEHGGRIVVGAIPGTGRLVLAEILGAGSPWRVSLAGGNHRLRSAGALVVPVHEQYAILMLIEAIERVRQA